MGLFDRLKKAESVPVTAEADVVSTGADLSRLAESNVDVVGHELEVFEARVAEIRQQAEMGGGMTPADWNLVRQAAERSANELSGYGIAVSHTAFEELV